MKKKALYSFLILLIVASCMSTADYKWEIIPDEKGIQEKAEILQSLTKKSSDDRPNVILIVADDLGKYEVSGYGATHIQTPNIDAIGENGVRFKDAHVTAPICPPSRAGILTGKYQQRYGFETQPMEFYPNKMQYALGKKAKRLGDWTISTPPSCPHPEEIEHQGIPQDQINLAEILKASGYSTGIIGKWHLGHGNEHIPHNRGFDYQYVFYGAFSIYTPEQNTLGYVNYIQDDMSAKHQWDMKRKYNYEIYDRIFLLGSLTNEAFTGRSYDPEKLDANDTLRVIKGGSFLCQKGHCSGYRPEARQSAEQSEAYFHIGFRVAKDKK